MSEFFAVAGADQDSGLHVLTRPASSYQRGIESAMGLEVLRGIVGDVLPELRNIAMQNLCGQQPKAGDFEKVP
jgi:hypothetical protein